MEKGWWVHIERACIVLGVVIGAATLYFTAGAYYGWNTPQRILKPTSGAALMTAPWWIYALGAASIALLATAWCMMVMRRPTRKNTMSGTELILTNGRWWHRIWAGFPFYSGRSKMRLGAIDSWSAHFERERVESNSIHKNAADTFIILSAGIESIRLQDPHPAWEIFFTAFNGGLDEVRLVSANGSFCIKGREFPRPAELKLAASAKHGEIALFTVRQWIDPQDVPQDEPGQNHVNLQLHVLKLNAIATDTNGIEHPFVVPLPQALQFDIRNHWRLDHDFFSRFYRERLGAD